VYLFKFLAYLHALHSYGDIVASQAVPVANSLSVFGLPLCRLFSVFSPPDACGHCAPVVFHSASGGAAAYLIFACSTFLIYKFESFKVMASSA
jgi:hypothetical protein